MPSINKITCTCQCGHKHTISEREIPLLAEMVSAMIRVARWAREKRIHEFRRMDIKHLLRTETESAHFGNLVYFGGIMYKEKKGHWGINFDRFEKFVGGELAVPLSVWKNPITKAVRHDGEYVKIDQVPDVTKYLDENKEFIAMYRLPQPNLV